MNVYGLIGFPLDHSFSKKYFLEKFERENIEESTFKLFPLRSITELKSLLSDTPDLKGLAVTIPYKVDVIPFLSEMTGDALIIGAVNCIKIHNCISLRANILHAVDSRTQIRNDLFCASLFMGSNQIYYSLQLKYSGI